jgi:hypothetical protein
VVLEGLRGTGHEGRVTVEDVRRAAEGAGLHPATVGVDRAPTRSFVEAPAVAGSPTPLPEQPAALALAVADADVSHLPDTSRPALVLRVAGALAEAFGRTRATVDLGVDLGDGRPPRVVRDAADLSVAGLAHRVAGVGDDEQSDGGQTLVVTSAQEGLLLDTGRLPGAGLGVLSVGTAVDRVVVIPDADGAAAIGVRRVTTLALAYDPGRLAGGLILAEVAAGLGESHRLG